MVSTRPFISKSLYQCFGDCTKNTNYNWYNRHFHVPQFFHFSRKVEIFRVLSILLRGQPEPQGSPCEVFSTALAGGLRSRSNSTSPQISRTILSIVTDLNNLASWTVFILPLISTSFNLFQAIGDRSQRNNNWYQRHHDFPNWFFFFSSPARSKYFHSIVLLLLLLFTPLEFFTSVLADGFSLEFE